MTKVYKFPPLHLSPTSLSAYYTNGCPARWRYSEEWVPKQEDEVLARGNLVHRLMEKGGTTEDRLAQRLVDKLRYAEALLGLKILERERKRRVGLWDDTVIFTTKIDLIGEFPDGSRRIVDYKTHMGYGWKALPDGRIPEMLGFQAAGYTFAPPTEVDWPQQVTFIVANRGETQFLHYTNTEADQENLAGAMYAVKLAWEQKNFPKVRGRHCLECPFRAVCFEEKDWRKQYKKRPKRKEVE